jgi:glycosyltransferase involved in cell wall biosynthesis
MPVRSANLNVPEIPAVESAMGPRPFWSVMIPAFMRTTYLERTLKSVLAQDAGPEQMQIEVVDDCSTNDDTRNLVADLGRGRVDFWSQPANVGQVPNWNTCIARSRGQWVHLLHDDDVVYDGFYQRLRAGIESVKSAEPRPLGMAFTRHSFIDENDRQFYVMAAEAEAAGVIPDFLERLAVMQRVQFAATVVRRDVYEQAGGFSTVIGYASDWEMWQYIASRWAVWYEPEVLSSFRLHSTGWTSHANRTGENTASTRRTILAAHDYLLHALPADKADALTHAALEHYAISALQTARDVLTRDDLKGALSQIREALRCVESPQVLSLLTQALRQDFERLAGTIDSRAQAAGPGAADDLQQWRSDLAEGWRRLPRLRLAEVYQSGLGRVQASLMRARPSTDQLDLRERESLASIPSVKEPSR